MSDRSHNKSLITCPRHRGIFYTLDMYVLREFMVPFVLLILAFVIMFMVGDLFDDLGDFLEVHSKLSTMATYFLLKVPGNIRFILPISVLLACMYTMANFGRNMEVTAMRASGVSLFRCGGSIFVMGLLVTAVNYWFNEQLVPDFEFRAEFLRCIEAKGESYRKRLMNMLTYRSPDKSRTWLFRYFVENGIQDGVTLKKYRKDGTLAWDIQAQRALFVPGEGWEFHDVIYTPYDDKGFLPLGSTKHLLRRFKTKQLPEEPKDIMNAVKEPEELSSWVILDLLERAKNMAPQCRAIYETIFYYRMAFPWACFLAVFLAVPLAAKNERGGIFLAIITAVVVIVVYQVTSHVFLALGKQGLMNPMFAGIAPTASFIFVGWYYIMRQT